MKTQALPALCAALFCYALVLPLDSSLAQVEVPVAQAADEVALLRSDLSALRLQSAEQARSIAKLEADMSAVAKAAEELGKTLDAAEAQGFTAGINFESRETLLSGWRRYLTTVQALGPKKVALAQPEGRRRR